MNTSEIKNLFNEFIKTYPEEEKNEIWESQSQIFKTFWDTRILPDNAKDLNDQELDDIIRFLDRNAKGNTKKSEAIAKAMIPQGAWRRMFNQIHAEKTLSRIIYKILNENNPGKKAEYIDELYKANSGNKNNLTGKSGNAINDFLAAADPFNNLSIISLNDRKKVMDFLGIKVPGFLDAKTLGQSCIESNIAILKYFKDIGSSSNARTITKFCYSPEMKQLWKKEPEEPPTPPEDEDIHDKLLFYMESQLEDFLIENWDKTELGKQYDLIVEDGDLVSQQYKTAIGKIDILALEKTTGKFVVIELKRNQTSDDTVGQLTRYMAWIEENKSGGALSKGIIIAGKYDERLSYSIKKIQDVEIYLYKVDFKLEQFKK